MEKKEERLKFEPKSKDGVFLGYAQYGGVLALDVAACRDKKTIRIVTTRGTTLKTDEFPMFYVAEMDREAEKALNILFASRSERTARQILVDSGNCRVCSLAIRGGIATCAGCRGQHRKHAGDASCRNGRCGGHTREEVLQFAAKAGVEQFGHEAAEALYSTSLEWLQPQEDGLRVAIKFSGTDDGFLDQELLPRRKILRGKQAQQPVVEQGQESDDDLFGGVRLAPAGDDDEQDLTCLLYTSPSPRDLSTSRMPSSA